MLFIFLIYLQKNEYYITNTIYRIHVIRIYIMANYWRDYQTYTENRKLDTSNIVNLEDFFCNLYDLDWDERNNKFYDIDYHVTRDFDPKFMINLAELFLSSDKIVGKYLTIEIIKYIFYAWKTNNLLFQDYIQRLKLHLQQIISMDKINLNKFIMSDRVYDRYKSSYYTWWLYGFYIMFDDYESKILKLTDLLRLEDAQDYLMYGIYQIDDCSKLYQMMIKLIIRLDENESFTLFFSATGALHQFKQISKKLKSHGYDILQSNNPKIIKILRSSKLI